MSGYTYTTISMHPGKPPRVGVNIYPDDQGTVSYYPADGSARAFLAVDYAGAWVHIGTTSETTVTDTHVKFARDLLEAAARFLADCERLRDQHARQTTDQTTPDRAA
ncbi:hypothetical protein AB0M95_01430 [Sphaerisporangium sp. NPDC051017]|uniref:hypothetical protein n=1 Tax=Sphaerisporangium sp. NPDC051017 TaxID=3154636 RepID=UPI00343F8CD9